MNPYVTITKHDGKPVIQVRIGNEQRHYPLTKAGCLQAGRELYKVGAETWMNSSSVDFPQEVKRGFRWDVRELLSQGFNEELEKSPRKTMIAKAIAFLTKSDEFLSNLDEAESKAWEEMQAS